MFIAVLSIAILSCKNTATKTNKNNISKPETNTADTIIEDNERNKDIKFLTKKLEKNHSKLLHVNIQYGAGKIYVGKTDKYLADIEFQYNDEYFYPDIKNRINSDTTVLKINLKKENSEKEIRHKNKGRVLLDRDIPIILYSEFGAGEARYNLSGMNIKEANFALGAGDFDINLSNTSVEKLEVAAGVGSGVFDLSGKRDKDLSAEFSCGIGDLTLSLPKDVGVIVKINGFLGDIDAYDFTKIDKRTFVNEAYKKTTNSVKVEITGGIGNVKLVFGD